LKLRYTANFIEELRRNKIVVRVLEIRHKNEIICSDKYTYESCAVTREKIMTEVMSMVNLSS